MIRQKSDLEADLESLKIEFDRNIEIQTQTLAQVTSSLQDAKAERALLEEAIVLNRTQLESLKGDYTNLVQEIEALTTNRQHCEAKSEPALAAWRRCCCNQRQS